MKTCKFFIISILTLSSLIMSGQNIDPFLNKYSIYQHFQPSKATDYKNVDGNPYLNSEFEEGAFYLADTSTIRLPLRYNIYTDEMEFQSKGVNYVVGNPESLKKILLGESIYLYLPSIAKGGYFELFESGKCMLVQKKSIKYNPEEGPKAIVGVATPAKFTRNPDVFYMIINQSQAVKIHNMKSVLEALKDQQQKIESFIKQEKIRNIKKQNLIQIVKYYNGLQ